MYMLRSHRSRGYRKHVPPILPLALINWTLFVVRLIFSLYSLVVVKIGPSLTRVGPSIARVNNTVCELRSRGTPHNEQHWSSVWPKLYSYCLDDPSPLTPLGQWGHTSVKPLTGEGGRGKSVRPSDLISGDPTREVWVTSVVLTWNKKEWNNIEAWSQVPGVSPPPLSL